MSLNSLLSDLLTLTDTCSRPKQLDTPYMNGRIGQLSLQESLALQTKESQRVRNVQIAAEKREERERSKLVQNGQRSRAVREMLYVSYITISQPPSA